MPRSVAHVKTKAAEVRTVRESLRYKDRCSFSTRGGDAACGSGTRGVISPQYMALSKRSASLNML